MSRLFPLLLLAGAAAVNAQSAPASSCGASPSKVPDCQHADLGSCGNACCFLEAVIQATPDQTYASFVSYLKWGGADGSFTYSNTSDAAGHNPGDDLRKYHIPGLFEYVFQGTHTTTGGYKDTLNFWVKGFPPKTTATVRLFSISNIHGALGDHGQNYKTLQYLLDGLGPLAPLPDAVKITHGCVTG